MTADQSHEPMGMMNDGPDEQLIARRLAALDDDALPLAPADGSDEIDDLVAAIKAKGEAHAARWDPTRRQPSP